MRWMFPLAAILVFAISTAWVSRNPTPFRSLYSPELQQGPSIQGEQKAYRGILHRQHGDTLNGYSLPATASPTRIAAPNNPPEQSQRSDGEGTEFWPEFLGVKLKITDTLLVLFTFALAILTYRLWKSTDKLWKAGNDAIEATERAFVFLEGITTEITVAADNRHFKPHEAGSRYHDKLHLFITRFAVLPKWKNGGNTPTRSMTIRVGWSGPDPNPPDYIFKQPPIPFFIAPQSTEISGEIEIPPVMKLIDWSFTPYGTPPRILIWGRADYEDIFGHRHFTEWCRELRLDAHKGTDLRATYIQWGGYNRTEESATSTS